MNDKDKINEDDKTSSNTFSFDVLICTSQGIKYITIEKTNILHEHPSDRPRDSPDAKPPRKIYKNYSIPWRPYNII